MRVMVFTKVSAMPAMDGPPTPEMLEAFAAMDRFTEELVKAGVFVAAAGLKNDAQAKRIVATGSRRTVTDGPFAETSEFPGGYYMICARDLNDAITIASTHSGARVGTVEVRRVFELPAD